MKFVPLLLALVLSAVACRKHTMTVSGGPVASSTLVAGSFIDSAGTYTHDDGSVTHRVVVSPGPAAVNCGLSRHEQRGMSSSNSSSGRSIRLLHPSDPWFIFVERPGRLWFFNGKNQLDYEMESPGGGGHSGSAIDSGKLRPDAPPLPPDLVPRLPEELRKLLPAVYAPGVRPSF